MTLSTRLFFLFSEEIVFSPVAIFISIYHAALISVLENAYIVAVCRSITKIAERI